MCLEHTVSAANGAFPLSLTKCVCQLTSVSAKDRRRRTILQIETPEIVEEGCIVRSTGWHVLLAAEYVELASSHCSRMPVTSLRGGSRHLD